MEGVVLLGCILCALMAGVQGDYWQDPSPFTNQRPCPCANPSHCERITTSPKADKEVFNFSVRNTNWKKYDWKKITTVVLFGYFDDDLMCHAHSQNARVVFATSFPVKNLTSPTYRSVWVLEQLGVTQKNFLDGINVDFEVAIPSSESALREALTLLIVELSTVFRKVYKNPQVSVDVAWSPLCVDQRCYDYQALSQYSDLTFVMSYDERSQIFGPCVAWANSAVNNTRYGLVEFLKKGLAPSKMVLGVPWYGYDYPCLNNSTTGEECALKKVPFRGVCCSDAAGRQLTYASIMRYLEKSVTGRLWDPVALSPYFTYKEENTGHYHQVWYDDPQSLRLKNDMADTLGLGGYGMWHVDSLDYSDTPTARHQRQEMWATMPDKQ